MAILIPEANTFHSQLVEFLWHALVEVADELKKETLQAPIDALVAEQEGHGDWGFYINDDGALAIWLLVDIGTITLSPDGTVVISDVPVEEDWEREEGESVYDHYYRILSQIISSELMPEKVSEDEPSDLDDSGSAELGDDGEEDDYNDE